MREAVPCDFPAGYDGTELLARLAQVLDPELDEPILDLGFVRSLKLDEGHAAAALQLPTSWCAVNFAYLMAEDVRSALLSSEGVRRATVSLGDHCAAPEIEAAVNAGQSFADAFPGEAAGGLARLRLTFLRKGYLIRQQRLLQALQNAGWGAAAICALSLGDVAIAGEAVSAAGRAPIAAAATLFRRFLERRAELGLDCGAAAALIVDLDGAPVSTPRLAAHYQDARTVRVALEANGSFCRALMTRRRRDTADKGGRHVPA